MLLLNEPLPVLSFVLVDKDTMGAGVVLHTTPLAKILLLAKSFETTPPLSAEVLLIAAIIFVFTRK